MKVCRNSLALIAGLLTGMPLSAAILPEDRADALYHYYDGGGVTIDGPSILVRKSIKETVSVFGNYYVDSISSASIDVITTGASEYSEERNEFSVGMDYLHEDTIMSVSFTSSEENDYDAQSVNIGIAQDVFGGMTTVTMSYGRGSDEVFRNGPDGQPDGVFSDEADRRSYRVGLSQVVTRNMLLGLYFESIADEGFLNNPYRQVRYVDPNAATGYSFESEVYPRTRSSNAAAFTTRYHLPYRAAVNGGYRFFSDSWGIVAHNFDLGYIHPFKDSWLFEMSYRFYTQSEAEFFSDLFPHQGAQNFLARDKELSTFTSHTLRFGASYDLIAGGWHFLEKATLNVFYDRVFYDYENFLDLRTGGLNGGQLVVPGSEPAYNYSADVVQLFFSVWF